MLGGQREFDPVTLKRKRTKKMTTAAPEKQHKSNPNRNKYKRVRPGNRS